MINYVKDSFTSTKDMKEALNLSKNKFLFKKMELVFSDFQINDENLLIQGHKFDISKSGVSNLCKTLKIPDPFAQRIPTDLFENNVNRLIQERKNESAFVFFNNNDVLIDIHDRVEFNQINTSEVLERINLEDHEIKVMFYNHQTKIELIPKKVEFEVDGLPFGIGIVIHHYPTSRSNTQALFQFFTLSCLNGSTFSRDFGRQKLNLKSTSNNSVIIDRFFNSINQMIIESKDLKNKIKSLKERNLTVKEIKKHYNRFKKLLGKDELPILFGKEFNNIESLMETSSKIDEDELTDINRFNFYYEITNYGSNITESIPVSNNIQNFAGKFLTE